MILLEEEARFVYDPAYPVPEDPELLGRLIGREARWSDTWADFDEDYTMLQLKFQRKKLKTEPGDMDPGASDDYETRVKLVDLTVESR